MKLLPFFAGLAVLFSTPLRADVVLAPLFCDGAVLQQGKPVSVWGKADEGEKVTVSFQGQKKETTADANGRWRVALNPLAISSKGAELIVRGKNEVRVKDVLVGEVWLCSGQSNMAKVVRYAQDFKKESAAADHPLIRHFKVELKTADAPQEMLNGAWVACTPKTVRDFTAVGYFFGRDLQQALDVPVGLINASYGGTPVEAWMSAAALRGDPVFRGVLERWKETLSDYPQLEKEYETRLAKWENRKTAATQAGRPFTKRKPVPPDTVGSRKTPAGLFNAMVNPLIPYTLRGIIWYQGEANAVRFPEYGPLFRAMITQWRHDFGQGDLPFYFVQLPNLERPTDHSGMQWAFQREAQATALRISHTGMAVTIDIGDPRNIHPKNKQEVGRRLALIALALAYEKGGEYAGPLYQSAVAHGDTMRVTFSHANGLKLSGGGQGFELSGTNRVFHPATATVRGESVIVSSPEVPDPVAVRYAWKNNPAVTLYNAAGLPAAPFRSDDWPAPENALPAPKQPVASAAK